MIRSCSFRASALLLATLLGVIRPGFVHGQESAGGPTLAKPSSTAPVVPPRGVERLPEVAPGSSSVQGTVIPMEPPPSAGGKPLPINLPTALRLGNAGALDIALASQRLRIASAQLDATRVLWLPSLIGGTDYARHDGQIQDVTGSIFQTGKQDFMIGGSPYLNVSVSDAIFSPLAARQIELGRQASLQAATNDVLLNVAEAYFAVQQARGELAGALDALGRDEDLLRRVEKLAPGLIPSLEINRTRSELTHRRQAVIRAQGRWRIASAELIRILHIDPRLVVNPLEPPDMQVTLLGVDKSIDELIPMALTSRPELAAQQAFVQATLERLKQERFRPLVPSILVRGYSTPASGTLGAGLFGGGVNGAMSNFGLREDFDVQALWQLQNLGFGNRAIIRERSVENQAAAIEVLRIQDRVAAEVVQAYALLQTAAERSREAETEIKNAKESAEQNLLGLGQTKRAGDINLLVIRPQEVVASIQALGQAYNDYFEAIADFNRAQFRLYRALGRPARRLLDEASAATQPKSEPEPLPAQDPSAPPAHAP